MAPLPPVIMLAITGIVILYITAAEITKHGLWGRELKLRAVLSR